MMEQKQMNCILVLMVAIAVGQVVAMREVLLDPLPTQRLVDFSRLSNPHLNNYRIPSKDLRYHWQDDTIKSTDFKNIDQVGFAEEELNKFEELIDLDSPSNKLNNYDAILNVLDRLEKGIVSAYRKTSNDNTFLEPRYTYDEVRSIQPSPIMANILKRKIERLRSSISIALEESHKLIGQDKRINLTEIITKLYKSSFK